MNTPATQPDLYEVLGISRDATPEEIKAAYRRASKAAHPDMQGGSTEAFAKVQRAWDVLRDPRRRAVYDATGDAQEQTPDNSLAKIHSLIMGALDRAAQGDDVDHRNIVEIAAKFLDHDRREGEAANDQLRATKAKFEKIRKRLRFKGDGPDLVDSTYADRIADIDRNIENNERVMGQVGEAMEGLRNGWTYEADARPAQPSWTMDDPRTFSTFFNQ